MVQKKGLALREWIFNKIQSDVINSLLKTCQVSNQIVLAVNTINSLDKIGILQYIFGMTGQYKMAIYIIYFLFFA